MNTKIRSLTEEETLAWPKTVIVEQEESFSDARGEIQPLVDMPMESCVLISSKAGTCRADHYHTTDWHYCYVLSGKIRYYHRPVGSISEPEMEIIQQGQLFFTPPMVEHTMYFEEDTSFLTLGRNSRSQEVYEADIVRIPSLRE